MTMGRRKSTRSATAPGNWKGRQPGPSRFSALPLRAHPHRLLLRLAADRDLARLRHRHLGDLDYQDAVLEACLDLVLLRSEEHTSELQSHHDLVCRLLL